MRIIVSNIQATGGGSGTTVMSAAGIPFETRIPGTYWIGLTVAVGSVLHRLLHASFEGSALALTAIRDNDLAAQSSGVNIFRSKLIVFVVAAFGCGVDGRRGRAEPDASSSRRRRSASTGRLRHLHRRHRRLRQIEGPIIGAVIFFALQQTLSQYGSTYMLLLGVIAVVMATKAPRGIWGWVVKLAGTCTCSR